MFHIKHFLKSLQHHKIITKHSTTSEIKKYKINTGFVILYDSDTIHEISYDRTMPEFLWIFANNSWKQLVISSLSYRNFGIFEKLEIF